MTGRRGVGRHRAVRARAVALVVVTAVLAGCGAGSTAGGGTQPTTGKAGTSGATSGATVTSSGSRTPSTAGTSASGTSRTSSGAGSTTSTTTRPTTRTTSTRPTTGTTTRTTSATVAPGVPAGMAGRDVEVLPTSSKVVALTFDAGANADGLTSILATLRGTGTPATFFLTGDFVDTYPDRARQVAAAGYTIGNHTQDHPDLTTLSDAAARTQITTAQQRILAVTGADPRPWFRFPFGARDARTIADANGLGYACVRWSVDTLGWKGTSGGQSATTVRDRVLAGARPGEVVLMHIGSNPDDGTTLDADALPSVVSGLRARGYAFVALDDLLG